LFSQLKRANEALKKLSHVNKKAFEQYNSFTQQREQLESRNTELQSSAVSIQELIGVLDQRKNEAIERTFQLVAKSFAQVWSKLVPSGKGELLMMKKAEAVIPWNHCHLFFCF
jgi:structural maintenance of chromosome 3 (chondroitin sulfate proteoglycan 6)